MEYSLLIESTSEAILAHLELMLVDGAEMLILFLLFYFFYQIFNDLFIHYINPMTITAIPRTTIIIPFLLTFLHTKLLYHLSVILSFKNNINLHISFFFCIFACDFVNCIIFNNIVRIFNATFRTIHTGYRQVCRRTDCVDRIRQ